MDRFTNEFYDLLEYSILLIFCSASGVRLIFWESVDIFLVDVSIDFKI